MAVRNELVDATMATRANGSTARKGAELSSRAAHVAVGGARPGSGRSTSTSAACARRSGAGQGEVPRCARYTLAALLMLALGIEATTVMFAVINSILLRPLSYPQPDRLVTLRIFTEQFGELWGFSNLDFGDAKRESQTLALAAWTYSGGTISVPGDPEYVNGRQISSELFSTLGISPAQGRAFRPDEDRPGAPPVAMISYGLWQRDFGGDPSAIGRSLVYEGKPYTVVGIAPAGF